MGKRFRRPKPITQPRPTWMQRAYQHGRAARLSDDEIHRVLTPWAKSLLADRPSWGERERWLKEACRDLDRAAQLKRGGK